MKIAIALASLCLPLAGRAADAPAVDESAELAKQLSNPIASLISVPFQQNADFHMGPTDDGWKCTMNLQPVIPVPLNKKMNLIVRTIIPWIDQRDVAYRDIPSYPGLPDRILDKVPKEYRAEAEALGRKYYNREAHKISQNRSQDGLGDITQSFFLSPSEPGPGGIIWGAGPVVLWPSATQDMLGSAKWGLGPTAVALKQSGGWTMGALANHLWSIADNGGPDHARQNICTTFVQPFVSYTTKMHTTYSLNTESTYNWYSSEWTVPINVQVSQILKIGKMPVSVGLGGRVYANGPSGAPDWGVRLIVTLLFPTGKHEPATASLAK